MGLGHIDERKFLLGYVGFSVGIRPWLIRKLRDEYNVAKNQDERNRAFVLALEQFLLLHETLVGFFVAVKNRNGSSILATLTKDIPFAVVYEKLKGKTASEIVGELHLPEDGLSDEEYKKVTESFTKLVGGYFQSEVVRDFSKNLMDPILNKLKHKLLVYKDESSGKVSFILDERKEKSIENLFGSAGRNDPLPENLNFLVEMTDRLEITIKELASLRILEINNPKI